MYICKTNLVYRQQLVNFALNKQNFLIYLNVRSLYATFGHQIKKKYCCPVQARVLFIILFIAPHFILVTFY